MSMISLPVWQSSKADQADPISIPGPVQMVQHGLLKTAAAAAAAAAHMEAAATAAMAAAAAAAAHQRQQTMGARGDLPLTAK